MTDKEFRRLSRGQLVDIIFELQKQLEQSQQLLSDTEARLALRDIKIAEAGSIAEAALSLNDVFAQAQAAADQYVTEVTRLHSTAHQEAENILAQARKQAEEITAQADSLLAQAQSQADALVQKAQAEAKRVTGEAQTKAAALLTESKQASETMVARAKAEREAILRWTES